MYHKMLYILAGLTGQQSRAEQQAAILPYCHTAHLAIFYESVSSYSCLPLSLYLCVCMQNACLSVFSHTDTHIRVYLCMCAIYHLGLCVSLPEFWPSLNGPTSVLFYSFAHNLRHIIVFIIQLCFAFSTL